MSADVERRRRAPTSSADVERRRRARSDFAGRPHCLWLQLDGGFL